MTILEVQPVIDTPTKPDNPIVHLVCCNDNSISFCGANVDPTTVFPHVCDTSDDCVVCMDLWKTTKLCPNGRGVCWQRDEGCNDFYDGLG